MQAPATFYSKVLLLQLISSKKTAVTARPITSVTLKGKVNALYQYLGLIQRFSVGFQDFFPPLKHCISVSQVGLKISSKDQSAYLFVFFVFPYSFNLVVADLENEVQNKSEQGLVILLAVAWLSWRLEEWVKVLDMPQHMSGGNSAELQLPKRN